MSNSKALVNDWFDKWNEGAYEQIPVTDDFEHTSPFGTISGKEAYLEIVTSNRDKFLGYRFEILDELYDEKRACVRYTAHQGDLELDVSEWYYFRDGLIQSIYAYYHIGEIRNERQMDNG